MKKLILSALCALGMAFGASQAQAQSTFEQGSNMLNLGVGLGVKTKHQTVPPISIGYERSVVDGLIEYGSIGLGAEFEYQSFRHPDKRGNLALFVGPRISLHYEFVDNLDTYITGRAGLELYPKEGGTATSFAPSISLGARYLFSDKFGIFTEVGTGISILHLGMSFNL
ncbi:MULTISPECIES: hypothetical protein [unclassified Porphyromonas]|uniref:hypothetical protein n=1 Tax=unclassified Porphyromonas TaxID=2645799 RepID=UPI00052D5E5F|nr:MULTISPECIES: hypothetical protein [unclassified Porphyromonas]KGN82330.1 hypothetical protein HQ41_08615 [Porphyromonas sp. COT-290 OH860]KGN98913.1 hypothetical protein HQ48_07175 [Porphyromonas sp. COT-290 OH3588]